MRNPWIYVVLSAVMAFAFAFPLFLWARERQREHHGVTRSRAVALGLDDDERDPDLVAVRSLEREVDVVGKLGPLAGGAGTPGCGRSPRR